MHPLESLWTITRLQLGQEEWFSVSCMATIRLANSKISTGLQLPDYLCDCSSVGRGCCPAACPPLHMQLQGLQPKYKSMIPNATATRPVEGCQSIACPLLDFATTSVVPEYNCIPPDATAPRGGGGFVTHLHVHQ